MKKSIFNRLSSFILALIMTATVIVAFPVTSFAEGGGSTFPENDPNAVNLGFLHTEGNINVSYLKQLSTADGILPVGSSTNAIHGGHHTRVLRTPYGTYAVIITNTEARDGEVMQSGEHGGYVAIDLEAKYGDNYPYWYQGINHYSVVRITSDGVEVIYEDVCPENQSSHVPEIYAGDDGRFFVCLPGEDPETYAKNLVAFNYGQIPESEFKNAALLKVREFDARTGELVQSADTIIPFDTTAMQDHGYGKPSACVDTVARKIYFSYNGAAGPAYFAMFIYDIDTGEFDPNPHTLTIPYRRDYYNMYPDGQGGMYFVIERCNAKSDAAELLGINFNNNNSFAWDGCIFYHIYDVAAVTYSNDADLDRQLYGYVETEIAIPNYEPRPYKNVVDSISHYGENGCTYLDDQNRLHVIYTHSVGNTKVTTVYHAILDTDGNILYQKPIPTSLLPKNGTTTYSRNASNGYTMTQGADGTYYIIRFTNAGKATIDIWTSPASDGINFTKAVGSLQLTTEDGTTVAPGYPIIGNSRDGSIRDGVIPILFNSTTNPAPGSSQTYYYFTVQICDHDYSEEVTEPTCTEQGYTTYTCSKCGHTYVDEESYVDALGHDYVPAVTEPPCTEQGFTTYTCSRCGDTYIDEESYVDALGHDYVSTVTDPTCTERGYTSLTCSRCGDAIIDADSYVDALGHDYNDIVTLPSCKESGSTTHVCSRCGDRFTDSYITALGHDWDEGVVTVPATTTSEGTKLFTCTRCGEKKTELIPKIEEPVDITTVFKDVKAGKWYTKAIDYVYTNGLMKGMTEDTFEPDTTMSRAMVVTVLYRMDGENKVQTSCPFTDLKANWYKDAVNWAFANGVVKGISETLFDPNGNVTREQLAAILYRYTEYKNGDVSARADLSTFPDASKVSKYARDAMSWAVAEGLITGNKIGGKDYLDPKGNATRAQVATILMRYLTKEVKGAETDGLLQDSGIRIDINLWEDQGPVIWPSSYQDYGQKISFVVIMKWIDERDEEMPDFAVKALIDGRMYNLEKNTTGLYVSYSLSDKDMSSLVRSGGILNPDQGLSGSLIFILGDKQETRSFNVTKRILC